MGIKATVYINSLGTVEDRQNYLIELVGYLRTKRAYLCEDCKKRITKNPLRVLDCKNTDCKQVLEEAPQIIDWLSESSKNYFMKVLEYLDEVDIPYVLQPTLVRGLDYYTDTVLNFMKMKLIKNLRMLWEEEVDMIYWLKNLVDKILQQQVLLLE